MDKFELLNDEELADVNGGALVNKELMQNLFRLIDNGDENECVRSFVQCRNELNSIELISFNEKFKSMFGHLATLSPFFKLHIHG